MKIDAAMRFDVTQALEDAENALRDFVVGVLERKFGADWPTRCGISPEKVAVWNARKAEDAKLLKAGTSDERLIYYADFRDLSTIIDKNWNSEIGPALQDKKATMLWLDMLADFRNPDAHRRELMPHQKALAVGISGELRTRLVRYRSKMETRDDIYPRIEQIRDSLGTQLLPPSLSGSAPVVVHPGDLVDFVITATDPRGEPLLYGLTPPGLHTDDQAWQEDHTFQFRFEDADVNESFGINVWIKTRRAFHAHGWYDDGATITYVVRPVAF